MTIEAPEWRIEPGVQPYPDAVDRMERRVAAIHAGAARELVWLVDHPPLYTAGTSAIPADLIQPDRLPVFQTGRGGRYTYHGPGQRVGYVLLDLNGRGRDVRAYVHALEGWIIAALGGIGIAAHRAPGRIGIWTGSGGSQAKIGAIGVRVSRWVTMHGFAINVDPDLDAFDRIIPCGLTDVGVTSLAAELGDAPSLTGLAYVLRPHLERLLAFEPYEQSADLPRPEETPQVTYGLTVGAA